VPNAPRIPPQHFTPPDAAELVSVEELNEIASELNRILAYNHIPPMPLGFTHFCIPFSPFCAMSYYATRTDQKLNEFIESINRKTYVSRNCHW
jgi:coproporphyrinogen III oxidase-like Fe-S oxidoreductase